MNITADPLRLSLAATSLLIYLIMCLPITLRAFRIRKKKQSSLLVQQLPLQQESTTWIVAFASQTGTTEEIASHTADTLRLAGLPVRVCDLSDIHSDELVKAERILFLVSTYGEGDPPDNAARFAAEVMGVGIALNNTHYAMLALGDRNYANFCGFGRQLDQWLRHQGARKIFETIEADQASPAAIGQWQQHLSHLAGTSDAPDWSGPVFADWVLKERRLLNSGSEGLPIFHLELEPANGEMPRWQSGDLAQVLVPIAPHHPREYSISSIPEEGRVHLLVRLHQHVDGITGVASGWLTSQVEVGGIVQMRVREHKRFRLGDNASRPLILIGNGSGIAGLRGHLKARANAKEGNKTPNWLIFGERNAAHDFHFREDLREWQAAGFLQRVDLAFSRDQQTRRYVQDCLRESAERLHLWIEQGAAIYVCGSLNGMAGGVDTALADILGRKALDALNSAGRYRRDVY